MTNWCHAICQDVLYKESRRIDTTSYNYVSERHALFQSEQRGRYPLFMRMSKTSPYDHD